MAGENNAVGLPPVQFCGSLATYLFSCIVQMLYFLKPLSILEKRAEWRRSVHDVQYVVEHAYIYNSMVEGSMSGCFSNPLHVRQGLKFVKYTYSQPTCWFHFWKPGWRAFFNSFFLGFRPFTGVFLSPLVSEMVSHRLKCPSLGPKGRSICFFSIKGFNLFRHLHRCTSLNGAFAQLCKCFIPMMHLDNCTSATFQWNICTIVQTLQRF